MQKYWHYFKRGWWAQLVMLLFNVGLMVLLFPLALIFHDNQGAYYAIATVAYVFVIVPLGGWLFVRFSPRFVA